MVLLFYRKIYFAIGERTLNFFAKQYGILLNIGSLSHVVWLVVSCRVRRVRDRQVGQCKLRFKCICGWVMWSTRRNFWKDCLKVTRTRLSCGVRADCLDHRLRPSNTSVRNQSTTFFLSDFIKLTVIALYAFQLRLVVAGRSPALVFKYHCLLTYLMLCRRRRGRRVQL